MNKDFDKFGGFDTENVLKNWESLVAENLKNDLEEIESPHIHSYECSNRELSGGKFNT